MKRILCILLSFALIVSMVGCGAEPSSESSSDGAVTTQGSEKGNLGRTTVSIPKESEQRLDTETDAASAVELYLVARMYLEKFLQYDIENGSPEEYEALLSNTITAFENAGIAAKKLETKASELEKAEEAPDYTSLEGECSYTEARIMENAFNPFVLKAYAAEESEAVKWAKDLTERFDKAPAGKGIRTLAEQMGTDAKHAYAQLKQAQEILKGAAIEDYASYADTAYKTAMVLKTAGTAAGMGISIATGGGAAGFAAVVSKGGIAMGGINTLLEVGQTGSLLIVGDDNKVSATCEDIENRLAPIGSVIGAFGLYQNLKEGTKLLNPDKAGELYDSVMYVGTNLLDFAKEGKLFGGMWTKEKGGGISFTGLDVMFGSSDQKDENKEKSKEVLEEIGCTKEEIEDVVAVYDNGLNTAGGVEKYLFSDAEKVPQEVIDTVLSVNSEIVPESFEYDAIDEEAASLFYEEAIEEALDAGIIDEDFAEELAQQTGEEGEEDAGDDEITDASDFDDLSEFEKEADEVLTASEIEGSYSFTGYSAFSGEEVHATYSFEKTGENALYVCDSRQSEGFTGTYNPDTSTFTLQEDYDYMKIRFTRKRDGKIHAKLIMVIDNTVVVEATGVRS